MCVLVFSIFDFFNYFIFYYFLYYIYVLFLYIPFFIISYFILYYVFLYSYFILFSYWIFSSFFLVLSSFLFFLFFIFKISKIRFKKRFLENQFRLKLVQVMMTMIVNRSMPKLLRRRLQYVNRLYIMNLFFSNFHFDIYSYIDEFY